MSSSAPEALRDVQAELDQRGIAIEHVGVSDVRYPLRMLRRDGSVEPTVCSAELTVRLEAEHRGTHMSRFLEALRSADSPWSPQAALSLAGDLTSRLDVAAAGLRVTFPLFVKRRAPVTASEALLAIDCELAASVSESGSELWIGATLPLTSLCPCSKEIADYSAHSQRGHLVVKVLDGCWQHGNAGIWPEELLEIADAVASAPIYPILKRADERYVTMQAYDNPAFVEDLARDSARALMDDERIAGFQLSVSNQESIHDHQAVARLEWRRL